MDKREFKDAVYGELETVGKAVANRHRLELLDVLSQGQHTVEELADETQMSVANTSQHLQRLKKARLVTIRSEGTYKYYGLADESVSEFFVVMRQLAEERLPVIDATVDSFFGANTTEWDEVADDIEQGQAVLLDTRPESEYRAGHLPGAISVPADRVDEHIGKLPEDKRLVAYCRGPYCTMADEAVEDLCRRGYDAVRVEMSTPEFISDKRGELMR